MEGTHFGRPLHQHSEKKGSSSDEMILHKVSKINGSERTLELQQTSIDCSGLKGNYFETIWIVSSQTLYFEMYYSLFDEKKFSEYWCNGLLNCVSFTYKKYFGVQVHFNKLLFLCV